MVNEIDPWMGSVNKWRNWLILFEKKMFAKLLLATDLLRAWANSKNNVTRRA
jgi:hypothetical protein